MRAIKSPKRVLYHLQRRRRWLKDIHLGEVIDAYRSYRRFISFSPTEKTILIVEPNEYHAEILPGYVKYFQDLGFKVVLITRKENLDSLLFSRFIDAWLPRIHCMNPFFMKASLNSKKISEYELVFISSNIFGEKNGYWGSYFQYLNNTPKGRNGYLTVEHSLGFMPESPHEIVDRTRIVMLTRCERNGFVYPMVNPHYFGNVKMTKLNKERVFITVGAVNSRNRDFSGLVLAVNKLVADGISNFTVLVVGRISDNYNDARLPSQIKLLGHANFHDLYKLMEKADFFLMLLDADNEGNRRYLDGETTGSRQLILGFAKVPLIQKEFAKAYGLTGNNAIIHQDNRLDIPMKKAINLSDEEYNEKRKNLLMLSEQIYQESLDNLKERVCY